MLKKFFLLFLSSLPLLLPSLFLLLLSFLSICSKEKITVYKAWSHLLDFKKEEKRKEKPSPQSRNKFKID